MDAKQIEELCTRLRDTSWQHGHPLPQNELEVWHATSCEAADELTRLQADIPPLVDAVDVAAGAIEDAIGDEDGLDGSSGYAVLKMLWQLSDKHGEMPNPELREAFKEMYEGDGRHEPIVSRENVKLQTEAVQHNTEYLEMSELLATRSREITRLEEEAKYRNALPRKDTLKLGTVLLQRVARIAKHDADLVRDLTESFDAYQVHCSNVREEQRKELASLQAIVEKLPKTKDGVPVVIRADTVWIYVGLPSTKYKRSNEMIGWWAYFGDKFGPCRPRLIQECYSSKEAAEAAREGECE